MKISTVTPVFTKMLTMNPAVRERMLSYCYRIVDEGNPDNFEDAKLVETFLGGFASITAQEEPGDISTDQVAEALGRLAGWV